MPVALFDTTSPLRALRRSSMRRITRVVDSGRLILGPEVTADELARTHLPIRISPALRAEQAADVVAATRSVLD